MDSQNWLQVSITNLDIDEYNLQVAYDSLAVVQMFRREWPRSITYFKLADVITKICFALDFFKFYTV
jgi:hypothetical protein